MYYYYVVAQLNNVSNLHSAHIAQCTHCTVHTLHSAHIAHVAQCTHCTVHTLHSAHIALLFACTRFDLSILHWAEHKHHMYKQRKYVLTYIWIQLLGLFKALYTSPPFTPTPRCNYCAKTICLDQVKSSNRYATCFV